MDNCVYVKDKEGKEIKIDLIFSFKVEEFNKQYIAYTLNDDGISKTKSVFISEINPETMQIIPIPVEQSKIVLEMYEEVKRIIIES